MLNKIISMVLNPYKRYKYKKEWRMKNGHNHTAAGNRLVLDSVNVGNYSYGVINLPYKSGKLTIGSFCSISDNVQFLTGGEHYTKHLSTYPFYAHVLNSFEPGGTSKGDIIVEDDVWIGYGSIILSGVRIGQGAIIGANSVVAKDIPPYAVYAGNRIVKYRFSDDVIRKLIQFDYNKLQKDEIVSNIELLYSDVDDLFFESAFYKSHIKE